MDVQDNCLPHSQRAQNIPLRCSFFKKNRFSEIFHSYCEYQLLHSYGPTIPSVTYRVVGTGNLFSLLLLLFGTVFPDIIVSHLSGRYPFYIPPVPEGKTFLHS